MSQDVNATAQKPMTRTKVPSKTVHQVLTEAGYRCAVPTCRTILALDLHHLEPVAEDGDNSPSNLLALCPTCHGLFHRGEIHRDALFAWKSLLVSLSQAFDQRDVDNLLFLAAPGYPLHLSGDGVARFARLIGSGLAEYNLALHNHMTGLIQYRVHLTPRGTQLVEAWKAGDRNRLRTVLSGDQSGG